MLSSHEWQDKDRPQLLLGGSRWPNTQWGAGYGTEGRFQDNSGLADWLTVDYANFPILALATGPRLVPQNPVAGATRTVEVDGASLAERLAFAAHR